MSTNKNDLVNFYDEFSQLKVKIVFLTHAMTLTIAENELITPEIISGAHICASELHREMGKLSQDMKALTEHQCDEQPHKD